MKWLLLLAVLDLTATHAELLQATSTGTWLGKPPLAIHSFDVTLHNPSKEARWLIVPRTFDTFPLKGGAPAIFQLSNKVMFSVCVGGNFQAVKLPGKGSITLRGLKIESWTRPNTVELEMLVAKSIEFSGQPLETWVKESASGQDVTAPRDGADERIQSAPKFYKEPQVVIEIESRVKTTVKLR